MIKRIFSVSILAAAVFISGCIGGKSVAPSYLRVGQIRGCEKVESGVPRLAIKRFSSLPALDRETVIVANGAVLSPDYRWSWEGTPAEILDMTAGQALSCLERYEAVAPYRPGIERSLVLSGVITSFEVQRSAGDEFHVAVNYSLWDGSGKKLLARRTLEVSVPVKSFSGHSIAHAAQQAVNEIMKRTIEWIDGLQLDMDLRSGR